MESQEEMEKAVGVLVGNSFWKINRTGDIFSFQFGERRSTQKFRGGMAEVGSFAINVQCPWRIIEENKVLIGSGDLYYPASPSQSTIEFDWQTEPTRFDSLTENLFQGRQFDISGVESHLDASVRIRFKNKCDLEIFPDSSEGEQWRLLRPGETGFKHFVVSNQNARFE